MVAYLSKQEIQAILEFNVKGLKNLWHSAMAQVIADFKYDTNRADYSVVVCDMTDTLLRCLHTHYGGDESMALIAVGGYGMGRQAPYSDIDILFLCDDVEKSGKTIENILYALWDSGLRVGQSIHSFDTVTNDIKHDLVFLTTVMTSRYLCGNKSLYEKLTSHLHDEVYPHKKYDYINGKMLERKNRHSNFGSSRYVLEPNVKEGKGGIRDFQTLLWIGRYVYGGEQGKDFMLKNVFSEEEQKTLEDSFMFVWRVRFALHAIGGRGNNTLSFDAQLEVAELLGYKDTKNARGVESFMRMYFLTLKNTGMLIRALMSHIESTYGKVDIKYEKIDSQDFHLTNSRLNVIDDAIFSKDPIKILEFFSILETNKLKVHPNAFTLLRRSVAYIDDDLRTNPIAQKIFLSIVAGGKDPARVLRIMNETAVLEAFLPEWANIVCQMQYNMYHTYTTDEHTLHAIDLLSLIERKVLIEDHPLCTDILPRIVDRECLYVAVLLHDIAKGLDGDHSIVGEEMARKICPRLGMDSTATDTIAWLIREHLTMSLISQRRDVSDPKTIESFCSVVKSITVLDMLSVLTVVDTRAVGPNVWNNWKAELLRRLHFTSKAYLSGSGSEDVIYHQVNNIKEKLKQKLIDSGAVSLELIEEFISAMTTSYSLSATVEELFVQALFVMRGNGTAPQMRYDYKKSYTSVLLHLPDRHGLMRDLSGVMAMLGAQVVEAQIHTLLRFGAVNTFCLQDSDGNAFKVDKTMFENATNLILNNPLSIPEQLSKRVGILKAKEDTFSVNGRVVVDNDASHTFTLIEIKTKNRMGLLYILTRALTELGLKIGGAKIATYGEVVVDVFYVKDSYGFKLNRKQTQSVVTNRLLKTLAEKI